MQRMDDNSSILKKKKGLNIPLLEASYISCILRYQYNIAKLPMALYMF
jgi:hypothetical protein